MAGGRGRCYYHSCRVVCCPPRTSDPATTRPCARQTRALRHRRPSSVPTPPAHVDAVPAFITTCTSDAAWPCLAEQRQPEPNAAPSAVHLIFWLASKEGGDAVDAAAPAARIAFLSQHDICRASSPHPPRPFTLPASPAARLPIYALTPRRPSVCRPPSTLTDAGRWPRWRAPWRPRRQHPRPHPPPPHPPLLPHLPPPLPPQRLAVSAWTRWWRATAHGSRAFKNSSGSTRRCFARCAGRLRRSSAEAREWTLTRQRRRRRQSLWPAAAERGGHPR